MVVVGMAGAGLLWQRSICSCLLIRCRCATGFLKKPGCWKHNEQLHLPPSRMARHLHVRPPRRELRPVRPAQRLLLRPARPGTGREVALRPRHAPSNYPYDNNLAALLHDPSFRDNVPPAVYTKAQLLRKMGNLAVHSRKDSPGRRPP